MRNKPFTRILCLVLAMMCLVGSGMVAVSADEAKNPNLTDKTIADYRETLDTISYSEYQTEYFGSAATLREELKLSLSDNWTFVNDTTKGKTAGTVVVTQKGDDWKLLFLADKIYLNIEAALEANEELTNDDIYMLNGAARVILETYTSQDDAVKAGFQQDELAYVTEDGNIYTPSRGSVTWELPVKDSMSSATLVSIGFGYYPIASKPSAVEREFYINGKVPYSEAFALRFSKIWSYFKQGSTAGGQRAELSATYTLEKGQSIGDFTKEAEEAGFVAGKTYFVSQDQTQVYFDFPQVITAKNSAFINTYGLRFFTTDINRNEIRPSQLQDPEWTTYVLNDNEGYLHSYTVGDKTYDSNYLGFVVTPDAKGNVNITLDGVNEPMELNYIYFLPYESPLSYKDYYSATSKLEGTEQGKDIIQVESENTIHTSTNVVYPIEDRTSPLCSPVDTTRMVLNTIGTSKWSTPGQWVEYKIQVGSAGWYDIYTRFKQSYLDGMYVSRSLSIYTNYESEAAYVEKYKNNAGYYNGLPFAEAGMLRYDYSTDWQAKPLTSDKYDPKNPENSDVYQLYFREGVTYTLRFEVTLGSMSDQVREIQRILNALNTAYLDILQLTGATPDKSHDYDFYRTLPNTIRSMNAEIEKIRNLSQTLRENAGVASTYTGVCDKLVDLLERMVVDGGRPIAENLDTFKSYVGSLGTFLSDAKTQPLQVDYLMIQPSTEAAPPAAPNFFQAMWHEILSFIQSFFRDYNSMGASEEISEVSKSVSVWLPYGRDQANVIRNLTTNNFTQETGISVDLKLVNGGTLLPSILAGIGPDVYHGLEDSVVINYAIRGAIEPLENMEGFDDVMKNFNHSAAKVLGIADADNDTHYYGLPETQTFSMMFVRLDILADLGIEIPKTWGDLYEAQTMLQSNNMEIGVAADYQIFLYQMGGDLWADDGMRINLDSTIGLEAFETMCDMFTQNSFPYQYDGANRFRTGEMPIIIAGYTALYNQLKVFATEIEGCWTFVPVPGTVDEETGEIHNQSMSSVNTVVMISGIENKEDAWKYMCWYVGAETQGHYANEMIAILGDSAKHPTANYDALKNMPWNYDEYVEVEKQFNNLDAAENYPGFYYIGRYTNFAFLSALNDDADPSTEILSYINTINTEITRKRQEFGLETLELGQKLSEKRLAQANTAIAALIDKYDESKYAHAIEAARYAIANASTDSDDYLLLKEAAKEFETVMLKDWDNSTQEITKVNGEKITKPSYYINVSKQTLEKDDGGYDIESLEELKLVYFLSEALRNAADALASY